MESNFAVIIIMKSPHSNDELNVCQLLILKVMRVTGMFYRIFGRDNSLTAH